MQLLQQLLNFLLIELTVLLTAALPIIELRGAIPGSISLGLSPLHAAVLLIFAQGYRVPPE
jgi:hypothetical protein